MFHKRVGVVLLSVLALMLLVPVSPAYAAPVQDDEVVFGDNFTLREGERIDGDLVVVGGQLTMREGSRVDGSVTVVGGPAEIDGWVDRDLVVIGGNAELGENARVDGDVVALGGDFHKAPGAQTGEVVSGFDMRNIDAWRDLRGPLSSVDVGFRPRSAIWSTLTTLGGAFLLALLGMAVAAVWPSQTDEVGRTVVSAPAPSLGIGCLVYPLAASLALFVLITICLAPFVPVVILLVLAASLFGWIALGTLFGRWLARTLGWRTAAPVVVTGLGVFALSILAAIVNAVPCLGWLLVLGAASVGLGAVVLSRFGTSRYGAAAAPPVPTLPTTDVEPSEEAPTSLDAAIAAAVASPVDAEPEEAKPPEGEGATEDVKLPEGEDTTDEAKPSDGETPAEEDEPSAEDQSPE